MNYLVKCLGFVPFLFASQLLYGQNFGIKSGMNLSNIKIPNNNIYKNRMNVAFHAGLIADFRISEQYSFETGLMFSSKGYKLTYFADEDSNNDLKAHQKFVLNYLEIPISAKYGIKLGKTKIYGQFGQYIGIGLFGKVKYLLIDGFEIDKWKKDLEWGSNNYPYQKLDFGLVMGLGCEIDAFQMSITYNFGLSNILLSPSIYDQMKIHNRVIGLSVGYIFGRN